MKKIWIIAADRKEIPGIDLLLKNNTPSAWNMEFHTCGIGLFESFYGLTSLLNIAANEKKPPDAVLLAGTAGSPNAEDLFKISLANQFVNPQFNFEELPEFLPRRWATFAIDGIKTPNKVLSVPVYSAFGVSKTGDHLSDSMSGAWENMEALSLSYACLKRQIPFMALLCCTNQICPDGRKQWRQNYQKAGEILFETLKILLKD
jgi:nucleoside phosphorylase